MYPTICQFCGQRMTEAELANPNVCLVCDPAVSASDGRAQAHGYLLQFGADESLALAHAEGAPADAY